MIIRLSPRRACAIALCLCLAATAAAQTPPAQTQQDEYTEYALLAPETASFKIVYDVTSTTGPRTSPTDPTNVALPAGPDCKPSTGAPGFTVTDTRTLRDVKTGQVRTERRTTKYNPSPIVTCGGG